MAPTDALYTGLYWAHVPVALSCVPAFWIAVLARKGGPLHVRTGRWFARGMRWVAATGVAMGLLVLVHPAVRVGEPTGTSDPEAFERARRGFAAFLLYLGAITFFPVHHGVRVIRTRRDPASIATPSHRALAWLPLVASVAVAACALGIGMRNAPVLLAMSPIGVAQTLLARRYLANPARHPRAWWPEHMTAMLVAGIAAHTALAVFFVGSLLGLSLPGALALLPWILPTIVGVPVLVVWVAREDRRLRSSG